MNGWRQVGWMTVADLRPAGEFSERPRVRVWAVTFCPATVLSSCALSSIAVACVYTASGREQGTQFEGGAA
jgi:hypothetical protein